MKDIKLKDIARTKRELYTLCNALRIFAVQYSCCTGAKPNAVIARRILRRIDPNFKPL